MLGSVSDDMEIRSEEFGEEAMKSWWVDKDCSEILSDAMIIENQSKEEIVQEILHDIQNK